jgi:CHAT domain-containing protein
LRAIPGGSYDFAFVDLGRASTIDSLLRSYRENIEGIRAGRRPLVVEERDYRAIAQELYKQIWHPLWQDADRSGMSGEAADTAPLVFLVADSRLHLVDFNTLLSPEGELVIERWRIHLLSSAQDLVRLRQGGPYGSGLLAVGNPKRLEPVPAAGQEIVPATRDVLHLPCTDMSTASTSLPGAEQETQCVAERFSTVTGEAVRVLTGAAATETAVKRELAGKRMAHFATHGFYCGESAGAEVFYADRMLDPLLRSGVVLASSPSDDGFLTAQELVCLDLQSLDWVVLSACGSGLGWLIEREGPFGLRRAFEMAGARTVVMALWRVDDASAHHLMEEIYRRRLAGSSTVDAIREAQLDRLRWQWERFGRLHPAHWGGIVAEGDWR